MYYSTLLFHEPPTMWVTALQKQTVVQAAWQPKKILKPSGIKYVQERGKQESKMKRHYSKHFTNWFKILCP